MKWKGFLRQSWICLLILGIVASISAKESSGRRWSVRKTGEFGRRVGVETTTMVSQELQLPSKQFRLHEPTLQVAETRRYDQFYGSVRKPSQSLELPRFEGSDQEAQETADDDGYAYAKPDGYQYNKPPIAADPPPEEPEPAVPSPPFPDPSQPELVAGPGDAVITPLSPLTQTDIDADSLQPQRPLVDSQSPQVSALATDHSDSGSSCTDDNDQNCWPHGYHGIPGEAGVDYPILSEIVQTDFNCDDQQFSGYYADPDERSRCQQFHICLLKNKYRRTRNWTFLCPNGTLYSQTDFVCVWYVDAPPCAEARSLYNLNEQLGWDNISESSSSSSSSRRNTNFRSGNSNLEESLQAAMSGLSPASASRNAAFVNSAVPTTYRPTTTKGTQASSARTALPYRVPVKVNGETGRARTKLQEVTQNALHGAAHELEYGDDTEHDVDESSNFETSLRQQSESRHKSKTASALHKSTSEAYELKGAPDAIQPLVVNRPGGSAGGQLDVPAQGDFDDEGVAPHHVVMMPSIQRNPDGSESLAEVPVMLPHDASEGYHYPAPTSTPGPTYLPPFNEYRETPSTTTENYPTPTIPTEPPLESASENYKADYQSTTTEQPSTTDQSGYRYQNPTPAEDSGYRYPNPNPIPSGGLRNTNTNPTTTEETTGYNYFNPTTTEQSTSYSYPDSTTEQSAGYSYTDSTTTEQNGGYRYAESTTERSSGYRYSSPSTTPATTEPTTTTTEEGYQYPAPNQQEQLREADGYRYATPTTTEQPTTTTNVPTPSINADYQVTGNDIITDGYQPETTTSPETPRPVYGVPASTYNTERNQDIVVSTTPATTTTNEIPVGGYLPPRSNEVSDDDAPVDSKQVEEDDGGDDDTIGISADEEVDYENEENEVAGVTGPADEGGYGYHLPTPPSSNPIVLKGGNLDSDEKLNAILEQIQSGGIEAVDSTGKPIGFSQLKNLLLNSPRGAVELKGEVDSVTSSSTEVPAAPQQPPVPQRQLEDQPFFTTVTTANIIPNNNNNNNNLIFNTNQNQQQQSGAVPSPSGFYLPPNSNNNNNQQAQQYYSVSNNVQTERPAYEIKLPNREFESHSVEANVIDTNRNNNNNNAFTQSQYQSQSQNGNGAFTTSNVQQPVQPQQQQQQGRVQYQEVNIPYTSSQNQNPVPPQQQFFGNQQSYSSRDPTPVIPNGNYLPPRQQDFERQSLLNNLVLPATQTQPQAQQTPQQQQQQRFVGNENQRNNNNYASQPPVEKPKGQYLPPRATSSILQSQFYTAEASQQPKPTYVSQPIQLNENLQLQQSFAIPLPPQTSNENRNTGRSAGVKDIKIVPALFVHQHTSVASQSEQQQQGIQGNIIENVFQTLEASPSNYLPSETAAARFGTRNSLAQQLNQIASNSANLPQATGGRQFSRRSNANGGSSSSSSPPVTIEKAPPVSSSFTLEDARTPDELQKYHHQDLKRFHKENIATQGSILDDSGAPHQPPRSGSASIGLVDPSHNNNRNTQRSHNNEGEREHRGSRKGNSGSSGSSSSSSSNSNSSNSPTRFSISSTSLDNSRGSGGSEDFFIPVSGSFGSGGSSNSGSTRSRGSSSRSGRGFLDSESETTLLRRFLPEEEGGFGSRLL